MTEVTSVYNAGLAGKQLSNSLTTTSGAGTYLIDESGIHDATVPLSTVTTTSTQAFSVGSMADGTQNSWCGSHITSATALVSKSWYQTGCGNVGGRLFLRVKSRIKSTKRCFLGEI